jgi:hypothetical protein
VFGARVPVPWGAEPKAQAFSGLTTSSWIVPDLEVRPRRYFEDLFRGELEISVLIRNPPVPLALERLTLAPDELPPDLKWAVTRGVIRALSPQPIRVQMTALPPDDLSLLDLPVQHWGAIEEREAEPPARARPQISMVPTTRQVATRREKSPLVARQDKIYRDLPDAPRVMAARPIMPSSLQAGRTDWKQMPPALAKWAVDRGIVRAEPPLPRRPELTARSSRKQMALLALAAGDWVRVSDLDIFPARLRAWLDDCNVKFIRCFGFGRAGGGGQGAITPINGYVTEDGVVFYCAEDNSTFYVQES